MDGVPETHRHYLGDDPPFLAFLATLMADGSPQVTPVWFIYEEGFFWVNTAKGRTKYKNMSARPQVALTIMDFDDPYEYLQVRGKVVEIVEEGAYERFQRISHKYIGRDFSTPSGQVRVSFKIQPDSFST